MVPNLFLTVAHFHFENFPWPYSQSIAQLQFSSSLSSSVARILQRGRGAFLEAWNISKRTWPKFLSVLNLDWGIFLSKSGDLQKRKKKRSSPKFKRFFQPQTGDLQKKRSLLQRTPFSACFRPSSKKKRQVSQLAIHRNFLQAFWLCQGINSSSCKFDFFKPKCSVAHCKILLWPTGWKPLI